jgi:hypothetical protein
MENFVRQNWHLSIMAAKALNFVDIYSFQFQNTRQYHSDEFN